MKKELIDAGYFLDTASNEWCYGNLYFGTIETAYAYLQIQKSAKIQSNQIAEYESALKEIVNLCDEDRERGSETSGLRILVQATANKALRNS